MLQSWKFLMAKWGVLGCGWGDVIVSLSNLYKNDCRKVIYLGKYKEIIPFLEAQDYIDEAKFVEFLPSTKGYWGAFLELAVRRENNTILEHLIKFFNFDTSQQYINCQLGFKGGKGILELVDKVNFSRQAIEESERIKKEYELEDFIIFQPTSFHSTPPENFYPYWEDVFKKTLELYPDKQIVLIGEQYSKLDVNHKKFIDLRGKFLTAESIGHLALSSHLVITLSNNWIYFCHMFDVPTINFCNKEFKTLSSLTFHKKTANYCIEIQKKENTNTNVVQVNSKHVCNYCNKEFTQHTSLISHLNLCKVKIEQEKKNKQEEEKNKIIKEYEEKIQQ